MTALLLVDIQNDFLPGGSLGVADGDKILPVINELLKKKKHFKTVVATKDWHPVDHGSFAETHGKKVGDLIDLNGIPQVLWPKHCVAGTAGAEFSSHWDHNKVDKVFHKGTDKSVDSYSAFFDNDHRNSTGLYEFLQSHEIKDIYIAGLTTDYCVKYSVLDALKLGYRIHIIIDACKPVNLHADDEQKALQEMLQLGANIIYSSEVTND